MKIKLSAVIPTVQYGNIQPEFEIDENDINNGEGFEFIEAKIQAIWDKYGDKPLTPKTGNRKLLKAFCGGEVYYDEQAHVYTNEAGEVYQSGSQYADTFRKPFDKQKIAGLMAAKVESATPEAIIEMWELKSQVSMDFGNSIHKALQLHEQYGELAESLNKTTHSHDHPVIKKAVDSFIDAHKGERVISEALVVDHEHKKAGQIDRLLITERKHCRVQDFKTNADITKEIDVYWKQLEFYSDIMRAGGWTVDGMDIFHYNGRWETYSK